jgi:hypothetical protein
MAYERNMRGTWKVRNPGTKSKHNYVIGMIYTANNIIGMLVEDLGKEVILQTKTKQSNAVTKGKNHLRLFIKLDVSDADFFILKVFLFIRLVIFK